MAQGGNDDGGIPEEMANELEGFLQSARGPLLMPTLMFGASILVWYGFSPDRFHPLLERSFRDRRSRIAKSTMHARKSA